MLNPHNFPYKKEAADFVSVVSFFLLCDFQQSNISCVSSFCNQLILFKCGKA